MFMNFLEKEQYKGNFYIKEQMFGLFSRKIKGRTQLTTGW